MKINGVHTTIEHVEFDVTTRDVFNALYTEWRKKIGMTHSYISNCRWKTTDGDYHRDWEVDQRAVTVEEMEVWLAFEVLRKQLLT